MGSNNYTEGGCYELDTSIDEAISYYRARQILQKRFADVTEEEFCVWVRFGYLHAFKSVGLDQQEKSRSASKLFTVEDPFAKLERRGKPIDLLLPYKFSRNEIENFDPKNTGGGRNPGGRFLTFGQAVQHLATYADEEYAEKLIDRAVRSGAMKSMHPCLGILTRPIEIVEFGLRPQDLPACLMFSATSISELCAEEFKGIEPHGQTELSDLVTSVESTPRTGLSSSNSFQSMTDLRWDEIVIQFITPEAVKICARRVRARHTYAEMGFKDGKSRDASPDSVWRILRDIFARAQGEVSWETDLSDADRSKLKKVVSILRKRLQAFFGITDDDPFYSYKQKKMYKTKFVLLPDEDSLDNYKARFLDPSSDDDDLESPISEPPFS